MERLTERNPLWINDEMWLNACEPDDEEIEAVYRKLKEYEDLEEQGRLLKLPCKAGDTVWQIMVIRIRGGENKNIEYGYGIFEAMVTELLIDDNMNILISTTTKGGEYRNEVTSAAIGETMFFTESEAEAKLKELRGGEYE